MIGPIAVWLAVLMVLAPAPCPTPAAAVEQQAVQAPPAQAPRPKKPPTSKLIQPWPDAATLAERRVEAESRRVFQQSDPLAFTLAADFKAVTKDRDVSSTKTFPAVLTLEDPAGAGKAAPLPVSLRTRGNFRLKPRICSFVPLAIEFPKKEWA